MDISRVLELVSDESLTVLAEDRPPVDPVWRELVEVQDIPDDGSFTGESITRITGQGDLKKLGPSQAYPEDTFRSSFRRVGAPEHYGRRLTFDEGEFASIVAAGRLPDVERNRIRAFRDSWEETKHTTVAAVYNQGAKAAGNAEVFDGTNIAADREDPFPEFIYDGKPLFSAAHPLYKGASAPDVVSNFAGASGVDLDSTTLAAAIVAFKKTMAVDERGRRFTHRPDVLLVPTELEIVAAELINSTLKPDTNNNNANALKGVLKPVSWSYLDDTDGWFVARAKYGIKAYDSGDLRVRVWYNKDTKQIVIDVDGYFGTLVTDWRHARGHNLATS